jgi:two-component system sensor histidine kinase/response regulator
VTKPFDSNELLARVKTHLELKKSKEKLKEVNTWLEKKVEERTLQLKKANKKLEAAYKELERLDESKSDFLNILSHEIRTPLNGILGSMSLLKDRAENENLTNLLNILDISVKRLEQFSFKALLITRLKSGNITLNKSAIPLEDLAVTLLRELNEKMEEKNISPEVDIPPETNIHADQEMINGVIESILENAIDYSDQNGKIKITGIHQDEFTKVEIVDEGQGFSEKALKDIFKPFSIGESHLYHKDNRIGLNLYMAKLVMDSHGGKIEVSNMEKKGAKVCLYFKNE